MPTQRPPTIDPQAAARWEHLPMPAALTTSPWLHEEVARRMEARLQWIVKIPKRWAHWGLVRGGLQAQSVLAARYKDSECFVLETRVDRAQAASKLIAKPWWNPSTWGAQKVHFEPPAKPVEMLWANMALHMAADPQAVIAQWHQLLEVDGFVMFSCLGPDTLRELRRVYAACGWPAPAHEFTDMHDWGDMLVAAGFAEPVMDVEHITLTFASPERLLAELRELGRNLHLNRFPGLRGRGWSKQLHEALVRELADPADDGRLKLSFEIIYGHAFKPAPRLTVSASSAISLQQMRGVLGLDAKKERLP